MALRRVYRQRLRTVLVLLLPIFLWFIIGEFGVFYLYSLRWYWPSSGSEMWPSRRADCLKNNPPYCYNPLEDAYYFPESLTVNMSTTRSAKAHLSELRMLVLSDPHIMCTFPDEPRIARWDADHYLKQSFSYLLSRLHPQPDIVVLLGDIFSNGFRASQQQWQDYVQCFRRIFSLPPSIKVIAVMGDNDVGGEGNDIMNDLVLRRYEEEFGPLNDVIQYKERQFVKLTTVCYINNYPKSTSEMKCRHDIDEFLRHQTTKNSEIYPDVIFSHVPLDHLSPMDASTLKSRILSSLVGTRFILSGHIHHTKYSSHISKTTISSPISNVRNNLVYEITVPTCSYRMGERHMGVGAAILTKSGGLLYKVLWFPPRYPVLISYVLLLILLALLFVHVCDLCSCKCL